MRLNNLMQMVVGIHIWSERAYEDFFGHPNGKGLFGAAARGGGGGGGGGREL